MVGGDSMKMNCICQWGVAAFPQDPSLVSFTSHHDFG